MMTRLLVLGLLLTPYFSGAVEKASPALQRERQTSSLRDISIKPLFVYSSRGRRDPFTFDISLASGATAAGRDFNISSLKLVGFLGVEQSTTALFFNTFRGATYRFRAGQLFSPEGLALENVKGAILPGRQVTLSQGESSILFRLPGNSKLQSLDATIAQDRKEQQR